jgi:hypothetical protein
MSEEQDDNFEHLGITHFLDFAYGGEPEWSLFAVKAPIEAVSAAFAEYAKAERRLTDVPRKAAGGDGDELAQLAAVVQIKDNPWTVVYRSLLWVDSPQLEGVPREARELSARLKTNAVAFIAEDTSGAMAYELFEVGKSLENAEWESGGDFFSFKSTLRKKPVLEEVGDEFADEFFREQGIYLPSCYPMSEGDKHWLAVDEVSASVVERADLIELPDL